MLQLTLLWRDWRQTEIKILLLALVVAVASITSIAIFIQRIENSMFASASELLAAAARIESSLPIPLEVLAAASRYKLAQAPLMSFQTMAFAGEATQLTSVKAVSPQYPLRGVVKIAALPFAEGTAARAIPAPGEVWLSSRLFAALNVNVGDKIELGEAKFTVTAAIVSEPDGPQSFLNMAPRVMVNIDDVPAMAVVQTGSRAEYSLLLDGEQQQVSNFYQHIKPSLGAHARWRDMQDDNSRSRNFFTKTRNYLLLAASLSLLLAGVAMALAAQEYAWRQRKKIALLKTLGQSPNKILRLYGGQFLSLAVVGSVVGVVVGWAVHWLLLATIQTLLPNSLQASSWQPIAKGFSAGCIIFLAFTGPAILLLRNSSPLLILQEFNLNQSAKVGQYAWGFAAVLLLIMVFTGQWQLSIYLLGATALVFVLAAVVGTGVIRLLLPARRFFPFSFQFGFLALQRHRVKNRLPLAIFALLFLPLLVMTQVRTRILDAWQTQLPANTPNHFLYNIFAEDRTAIEQLLAQNKLQYSPFYPMLRGRIIQINEDAIESRLPKGQSTNNYTRELNLTWAAQMAPDNKLVQGRWWSEEGTATDAASVAAPLQVSMEEKFAEGLAIKIGDTLTLSLAGQEVVARVSSLRSVHWDAMTPNFFVIFNRPPIASAAANWITSFYLGADQKKLLNQLVRAYPNISVIELDQTLAALKNVVTQLSRAIEAILGLILLAAAVVLITSVQSTLRLRVQESAIMRIAGADRKLIHQAIWLEFFLLGWLATILGLIAAELSLYLVQTRLMEIAYEFAWLPWLVAPWLGGLGIASLGWLATRHVSRVPLLTLLRST